MESLEQTQAAILDAPEVAIIDDSVEESVGIDEYAISSYGLDFDVEGIVRRYNRGDIVIPEFQRKYVWRMSQASRFVESLLLGLPVPGIFLYREDDTRELTVIDGQQRILTLHFFYEGVLENGRLFQLSNLASKFDGQTYKDLEIEDRRKLDDSVIHATIVRQEKPEDDGSSKFSIFERLNTGGTNLHPQEIRSAIYSGPFCEVLVKMNKNESWRKLFGKPNKRKRDEELILRFLALFHNSENYRPSMTRFLNEFMLAKRNLEDSKLLEMENVFNRTTTTILKKIGDDAFKPQKSINAAVLDAIMVGVATRLKMGEINGGLVSQYKELLENPEFDNSISVGTSQGERVRQRIMLAVKAFADAE
ncbi:MAG: DUF262 domain-containing protein [Anaerolineaceae bacterium]|nr:DUF262 domain-containing protein [Anaerolineaceae bacterium]MDE0328713.1 DUF262 domain-containing protein [Anaerolineaceae bacterium]